MVFCLFVCILIVMPLTGMLCGIAFGFYMMYYLIKDAPKMLRETFDEMKKEPAHHEWSSCAWCGDKNAEHINGRCQTCVKRDKQN
jgi:cytochrome b561